ncbi:hypothetical protein CBF29_07855 [Vagococcus elongatus]|uniref:Uncharacterized protein n=2 Tax=Vagococcus elongatus TaxID=180344 RepID=A0A430AU87_9ENTE|nr:hypothetical protein CBF29_07855 [Vagococcus elongatus]
MTILSIASFMFLVACKQSTNTVVSIDEVDKAIILVKDNEDQERKWTAQDQNFLKTLLGNINLLFDESDENAQRFDMELTPEQRDQFEYHINFYKKDKLVQEIKISNRNNVDIGKENFVIKKDKELDSLKSHLLLVAE